MSLVRFINNLVHSSPRQIWNSFRKLDDIKWGKKVGVDQFGNTYYENPTERYGRDRWVVTAGPKSQADANKIPPVCMKGESKEILPKWINMSSNENPTGTSKGYKTYNTTRSKYSAWEPEARPRS
ncbi:hypothetical protein EV182_003827 [Spiromyces aspiralis]|uniref:Uncharacterized protein n=1 Tax=Spiromyces aspiralis TaxID=68401 RepID=A0ACC1HCH4_9FUNG|nr:hypothetical protein EV182_003827 [Spiromyces aspiralis]